MRSRLLSDPALIRNLAAGIEPGFTVLYEKYSDRLFRYALLVSGSSCVAEEATQDTFLYAIEHSSKFDGERSSSALGWLYGTLRNRVRSRLRHTLKHGPPAAAFPLEQTSKQRGEQAVAPEVGREPDDSPARRLELSRSLADLMTAIDQLPLDQREVLVLCALQDMDYQSASAVLGTPVGTVRSRLSRARSALRVALPQVHDLITQESRDGT